MTTHLVKAVAITGFFIFCAMFFRAHKKVVDRSLSKDEEDRAFK